MLACTFNGVWEVSHPLDKSSVGKSSNFPFMSANFFTFLYCWNLRRRNRCCGVTESSLVCNIYSLKPSLNTEDILQSREQRPFLSAKCRCFIPQEICLGMALKKCTDVGSKHAITFNFINGDSAHFYRHMIISS